MQELKPLKSSTGKELKIALIRADLTQQAIAQRLGVSPRYVRYIIAGKRKATKLRERIANEIAGLIPNERAA